jgi:CheY-like chemotaxis protein
MIPAFLIPSDHKANQDLLASMLRQQGYKYEIVENGQDAVQITAGKEYDLILMVITEQCIKTSN